MGMTADLAIWSLLRASAGFAAAYVFIATSAWCLARLSAAAALHTGLVFTGIGAGIAAAGLVVLLFAIGEAPSSVIWIGLGVLTLIGSVFPAATVGREGVPPAGPLAQQGWTPRWAALALCYGAFGYGYIIPATFLPAMARALVPDPAVFGWIWPLFGITAAVATLAAATALRRFDDRHVWIASYLLMAVGLGAPLIWAGIGGIAAAALLVGATCMVSTLVGMRTARAVAGAAAPRLMAVMTAAFATGQVAGPVAAGWLVALTGTFAPALFSACSVMVLAALGLMRFGDSGDHGTPVARG